MNGFCRWCYELTASPETRWHLYARRSINFYLITEDALDGMQLHDTVC